MKRLYHIVFVGILLSFLVNNDARAQGNVVVHSDPRLSLLVRKPHNVEQASTVSVVHKTAKKSEHTATVENAPATASVPVRVKPEKNAPPIISKTGQQPAVFMPSQPRRGGSVYSAKGFRVQIYNGPDRNKAIMVKTEFMRTFPGIRTYLTYVSPCFRVKVGDYRHRADAEGMLREANAIYNPSMIVPDIIRISTF
jgi:hypothetical protein